MSITCQCCWSRFVTHASSAEALTFTFTCIDFSRTCGLRIQVCVRARVVCLSCTAEWSCLVSATRRSTVRHRRCDVALAKCSLSSVKDSPTSAPYQKRYPSKYLSPLTLYYYYFFNEKQTQAPANRNARSKQWQQDWLLANASACVSCGCVWMETGLETFSGVCVWFYLHVCLSAR